MGLLDDAIREHLDLKRRRGADPTEVERAEREALGPVRRSPEIRPGDEAVLASPPAGELAYEDEAWSAARLEGADAGLGHTARGEPAQEPDFGDDPSLGDYEHEAPPTGGRLSRLSSRIFGRSEPDHDLEFDDEPHPHSPPAAGQGALADEPDPFLTAPPPGAQMRDETVEFDVDEALAGAKGGPHPGETHPGETHPGEAHPGDAHPAAEDEDVLEETPEFLQDTPDHDRLWFEQRPPRDFDFDK